MQRNCTTLDELSFNITEKNEPLFDVGQHHALLAQKKIFSEPPSLASHLKYRAAAITDNEQIILNKWKIIAPKKIVHIGLGGSIQGVKVLKDNLSLSCEVELIDIPELATLTKALSTPDTIVLLVSKSGQTQEALTHLSWCQQLITSERIFAVTANPQALAQKGIPEENIVPLDANISGRFSTFSPTALAIKYAAPNYIELFEGVLAADAHVQSAHPNENIAAQIAAFMFEANPICHLSAYWSKFEALIPFVQQLHMESLGKQTTSGQPAGTIVFGGHGIRGQHSYYQYLHGVGQCFHHIFFVPQGRDADVQLLAAHAQSQFEVFHEKRHPFVFIQIPVTPRAIGILMSLFEHAAIIGGLITAVHPFTQPGVEAGKKRLLEKLGA